MIVCPSMYPQMRSWGETQRMYYLANYLEENGWHVVTVARGYGAGKEVEKKQLYKSVFLGEAKKNNDLGRKEVSTGKVIVDEARHIVAKFANYFCNFLFGESIFVECVEKTGWVRNNRERIVEIIAEEEIDIVIISGPSFRLFSLGNYIKEKYPNIKLVYDYRDPWYLWKQNNLSYLQEKRLIKRADHIVAFSEAFRKDMMSIYGIPADKITTIYNGYSGEAWQRFEIEAGAKKNKLILTYTGMAYLVRQKNNYRDLSTLIDVVKRHKEIELYLVGVCGLNGNKVEENVHFIETVTQEESFEYMLKSDVLISMHDTKDCSQKYIISGKFYDYLKSERIIWHIGAEDSLMSSIVKEQEQGVISTNDEQQIELILEELIKAWSEGYLSEKRKHNEQLIHFFEREYQNKRYEEILDKLC